MTKSDIQAAESRPVAPTASRGPQAAAGLTGADVLRIIRRRLVLVSVITAAFLFVFAVGVVLWRMKLPRYTATARVEVTPPLTSALQQNNVYRNSDLLDRHKQTTAVLIKTRPVLMDALKSPEMGRTEWFRRMTEGDPEYKRALSTLEEDLGISIQPSNDYIVISMSMYCGSKEEKEQLPTIVNAVADAFVEHVNDNQEGDRGRSIGTLELRREELDSEIEKSRTERTELLSRGEVPVMQRQFDAISQELDTLIKSNAELEMAKANIDQSLKGFLDMKRENTIEQNQLIQQAVDSDPILRNLETELTASKARLDILASQFGPKHRQLRTLKVKIEGLTREIAERRKEVVDVNVAAAESSMEQELVKLTEQLSENAQRQEGLASQRTDLNRILLKVEDLESHISELSKMRTELDNKITDLQLVRDQNPPAKVLNVAVVPLEPSGPKPTVWVAMGLFLGAGLGIGLAFMLELSDSSVKTPTDIVSRVRLPLLSMLPHSEDMEDEIDDFRTVCAHFEHTMVNEAFRELRSNLDFSGPIESRRTMLIASPSPGDGRTSVAFNLALTIARSGRKVLLVDANFRRPRVASVCGIDQARGLSDILSGQSTSDECVAGTEHENLFVLPAGKLPPNPNELLSSSLADKLIDELSSKYDQVIFDGPPVMLISEARVLANRLDSVVLVVRAGENSMGIVQRCRSILDRTGANVLGVVLNGIKSTTGGYLLKNYEAFSDYHEQVAEQV